MVATWLFLPNSSNLKHSRVGLEIESIFFHYPDFFYLYISQP